jgi:hypothetical protein
MRTMMKVTVPVENGNKAIKDGSIGSIIETTMADIKPECAFFTVENGIRTAYFVFDFKDASDMPRIGERLFMALNAQVQFNPVMNLEELKKGLQKL